MNHLVNKNLVDRGFGFAWIQLLRSYLINGFVEGHGFDRLREKGRRPRFSWKSGASAPRKSFGIEVGFSPCGRADDGNDFFRSLLSRAVKAINDAGFSP